jgi:co-chaperonin GroES (HSP10)
LVQLVGVEESGTKSGIIIPDTAKENPRADKVIEAGSNEDLAENIKLGDKIFLARFTGDEIKFEGKNA